MDKKLDVFVKHHASDSDQLGSQGQGQKVVNVDLLWKYWYTKDLV